jgi:hypothetical protein
MKKIVTNSPTRFFCGSHPNYFSYFNFLSNFFSGANPAIRFNLFLAKEARKRISTSIGAKKHQVCHFDNIA